MTPTWPSLGPPEGQSDLYFTSVFELFVFSDVLEANREILIEGSSLILTLFKNVSNDENRRLKKLKKG